MKHSEAQSKGILPVYLTVEEMRRFRLQTEERPSETGGTRFQGSTTPDLALQLLPRDGVILECGPHFGMFTKFLQEHGFQNIHALDVVDVLHFSDRRRVTFHEIDFNTERMPYPDNYFDGITAWGIIEHMENPYHFLREAHRVLKPGAPLLLSLPNVLHVMSRIWFLRTGVFPRWNERTNHIFVLPRGVFEKTVLRYFDLAATRFTQPGNLTMNRKYVKVGLGYRLLDFIFQCLPANEWFGNYVVYVLRKKAENLVI